MPKAPCYTDSIMIGYISGTVHYIPAQAKYITVLTNSGVGYNLYVTNKELYSIGELVSFYTITIVREDILDLYGFTTTDERELCELLMSVSGVGPKTALGIVNSTTPHLLVDALRNKNTGFLSTLPGIGKKGAEKMSLELHDKVKNLSFESTIPTIHNDLIETLIAMGYQPRVITEIISGHTFITETIQDRIREALVLLQKK